ncbi:hypothetical protein [Herbiconiux flava]|uniref:Uncharacterized protein n=2 Tax=Herbiconiux flava TaxID=881268 RepID=A0A852SSC6_9MICO|nr:hypothetical protein [Herbiconiux flava]NYD71769.1 hypothetical protein [Herbiconiux flava]GLK18267.1 hypothetical protein GCM10017602_27490 [Herbiconiux flava]
MTNRVWTTQHIDHRRRLHARIDTIAGPSPAAAARLRLALYTVTHEADTGVLDAELLTLALDELDAALTAAAVGSAGRAA